MIRRKRHKRGFNRREFVETNHNIRFPEVRVLTERGEMIGVMTTSEALSKARLQEKDLVLVTKNAQPPIAKIIDLAKYRYQLQQKKAEGKKKAKRQDLKEVRFTPFMGKGDFRSRLNRVINFLHKGDKVRLSLQFKGRAITKKQFGFELFEKIFVETAELAQIEIKPKMVGKKLIAQLTPIKKKQKKNN